MSEPRTTSTVNAGRSRLSIVFIGLMGLLGMVYLLWPREPAVRSGALTEVAGEAVDGLRWEARSVEGRALVLGPTMGTTFTVVVAGRDAEGEVVELPSDEAMAGLAEAIYAELEAVNDEMSTYRPESELSRFNRAGKGQAIAASAHLVEVMALAKAVSADSGGAFDVTVGPLVDAWGFGSKSDPSARRNLSADDLSVLDRLVGDEKLIVDVETQTIEKTVDELRVDLSAIAKGHGCDRVAAVLEAEGFRHYMVEVGGEVRARGRNHQDEPWRVGIERPTADAAGTRAVQSILPVTDAGVATSGDYRNYWEEDGVRYSHTIDPRTGRPITHRLASVTVVHAQSAAAADAWATALNVLGPKEGLALATREGLAAYFLIRTAEGFEAQSTPAYQELNP